MELTSRQNIRKLLSKSGSRPNKGLGQNFVVSRDVLKRVASAAELSPKDVVLEIGPGLGTLTKELAKRAKEVVALEKDRSMVEVLKETLAGLKNVSIVQGDALRAKIPFNESYKAVGNLPFYITAHLIRRFLELNQKPSLMVFLIQKEVGQRICSKPPDMSLLAVSVQFYAEPKIVSYVSRKSFWPQPKVDAAIVKITPKSKPAGNSEAFFKIIKAGFAQPRKQLLNNLSNGLKIDKIKAREWLLKNNVQPSQRAETLAVEDWIKLTENFKFNNEV